MAGGRLRRHRLDPTRFSLELRPFGRRVPPEIPTRPTNAGSAVSASRNETLRGIPPNTLALVRSGCAARGDQPATIVQRHGGGQLGGSLGNERCKISGGRGHDHHGHDHHGRDHGHGDNPDHGRGPTDGHVPSGRAPLPSSPRRSADRHDAARPRPRRRRVGGSNSPRATCNGSPLDTSNPAPKPILGRERAAALRPPAGAAAVQFSRQWRCRRRKLHRRSA